MLGKENRTTSVIDHTKRSRKHTKWQKSLEHSDSKTFLRNLKAKYSLYDVSTSSSAKGLTSQITSIFISTVSHKSIKAFYEKAVRNVSPFKVGVTDGFSSFSRTFTCQKRLDRVSVLKKMRIFYFIPFPRRSKNISWQQDANSARFGQIKCQERVLAGFPFYEPVRMPAETLQSMYFLCDSMK